MSNQTEQEKYLHENRAWNWQWPNEYNCWNTLEHQEYPASGPQYAILRSQQECSCTTYDAARQEKGTLMPLLLPHVVLVIVLVLVLVAVLVWCVWDSKT